MRVFPFRFRGRLLRVVVVAIPEAWQLWICEEERRLAYAGHVSVDEAIAGWRIGEDRVLELAEEVKSHVLTGKLPLGAPSEATVEPTQVAEATRATRPDSFEEK
jgi:hypothetical protein